jgi:hypothetical protein
MSGIRSECQALEKGRKIEKVDLLKNENKKDGPDRTCVERWEWRASRSRYFVFIFQMRYTQKTMEKEPRCVQPAFCGRFVVNVLC